MNHQSVANKKVWSHKTYKFLPNELGSPSDIAHDILADPKKHLSRQIDSLALDIENLNNKFDITYLEGGILHYFSDLNTLSKKYIPC